MPIDVSSVIVAYGRGKRRVVAVDDVSIRVEDGAAVGLVGESGSGKSSLARAIAGVVPISRGEITVDGKPAGSAGRAKRAGGTGVQLVFQNPYSSLDPRQRVGDAISEARRCGAAGSQAIEPFDVRTALRRVLLDPASAACYPFEMSGGQRQRVAIARALAASPRFLIADEVTSALDVSSQASVLNMLRSLQQESGFGLLFVSHNLAVVRYMTTHIYVMRHGKVVESGETRRVLTQPRNRYTRELIDSVPALHTRADGRVIAASRVRPGGLAQSAARGTADSRGPEPAGGDGR